jgi:hypothetical protein
MCFPSKQPDKLRGVAQIIAADFSALCPALAQLH